jgi:hypothetical protein
MMKVIITIFLYLYKIIIYIIYISSYAFINIIPPYNNSFLPKKENDLTCETKTSMEERECTLADFTINELVGLKCYGTLLKNNGNKKLTAKELNIDYKTLNKFLGIYNSIGKIPNVIGINPINDGKNSKSKFQK